MTNAKVLIVEDDSIIAKDIEKTLLDLKCKVSDIVDNAEDVFKSIEKNEPNIIIMDITLIGDLNGIDIIEKLYKTRYIPVVYVTASDEDDVMDRAIKTDPIGYVVKPWRRSDLKSVIKLALYKLDQRNKYKNEKGYTHIGLDYYYDFENKKLYYKEKPIHLGKNELRFLELLIEAKGQIVLFDEIYDKVWEEDLKAITKNAIRVMTFRLRTKVHPKLIESVPYQGYRLNIY